MLQVLLRGRHPHLARVLDEGVTVERLGRCIGGQRRPKAVPQAFVVGEEELLVQPIELSAYCTPRESRFAGPSTGYSTNGRLRVGLNFHSCAKDIVSMGVTVDGTNATEVKIQEHLVHHSHFHPDLQGRQLTLHRGQRDRRKATRRPSKQH